MLKWSTMLDLLRGAGMTVTVSCLAIAAGVPLGLLLALAPTRRRRLPALVTERPPLTKAGPAVAIIGVVDLPRKARQIAATTYEPLPPFVAAAVVYGLALALLVAGARTLERSLRRRYGTL